MKYNDLNGQRAKINKSSITVKDENGKTAGVITQVYELQARDQSSIWSVYRRVLGLDATSAIRCNTRKIAGTVVFLASVKSEKEVNQARALQAAGIETAFYYPY